MANVEEVTFDLATLVRPGDVGALVNSGREVTDVYIAEMPLGAPVMLMIGLNAAAGFRNIVQGDSFDCTDRETCRGETEGIGVKILALTAGTFRLAVTYKGGGASVRN